MNFTNTNNMKGAYMRNAEQRAKSASKSKVGIFAKLSNAFDAKGTTTPSTTPTIQPPVRPHLPNSSSLAANPSSATRAQANPTTPSRAAVTRQGADSSASPQGLTADPAHNVSPSAGVDAVHPADIPASSFSSPSPSSVVAVSAHSSRPSATLAPSAPSDARTQSTWRGSATRVDEAAAARSVRGGARGVLGRRGGGAKTTPRSSGTAQSDSARAAAVPALTPRVKGSGARPRRLPLSILCALALLTSLAFASSASAATLTAPVVTDPSYTTAKVSSEVDPQSDGFVSYAFQISTNGTDWTNKATGAFAQKETLTAELTGLEGGTHYFVRLAANKGFGGVTDPPEVTSPGPNPDLTTLTADPPTIPGPVAATAVFSTSATATGEINRPVASDDVNCSFEYITDEAFTGNPPGEGFNGAAQAGCEPENPVKATGNVAVSAKLSGLSPATIYHLRLSISGAGGSESKDAPNFTTAPKVAAPTVIKVNDATDVSYRTATLSGEVQRPAGADPALDITSCRFEYVTDEQFTNSEFAEAAAAGCDQTTGGPISAEGPTAVTASLNLKSGVTYHYRLAAENSGGTDTKDAANTFTTIPGGESIITTDSVSEVGYSTARVTGTVTQGAISEVACYFGEYAEVGTENWNQVNYTCLPAVLPVGSPPLTRSLEISSLAPETEYMFRFGIAVEPSGERIPAPSPYPTATTRPLESPTATLDPVSNITGTGAHFSGTVDTHAPAGPLDDLAKAAYKTDWKIECTPECLDPRLSGTVEGEEGSKVISADVDRLDPDTHYEQVKLVAHNELYSVETPAQAFDTLKTPPSVKQTPGSSDGTGGYTLQGVVNPNKETLTDCEFRWGPKSNELVFGADCSPLLPDPGVKPTTVEAHLTGLTPDVDYYSQLVVTYGAGLKANSGDPQAFKATIAAKQPCPANEARRTENSSLALPECRAYEMVTAPGKEGFNASLHTFDGGDRVAYISGAPNIAKSGQGTPNNSYVAYRSPTGWETISNLNGSSGSWRDEPSNVDALLGGYLVAYSSDLLSSVWGLHRLGEPGDGREGSPAFTMHLRSPDGMLTSIGPGYLGIPVVSDDLLHVVSRAGYEYVGTGNTQPRRVDLDNSGGPIATCGTSLGDAQFRSLSSDGTRIILRVFGGCGAANPPAGELWARVNGTTSFDVSASHCNRTASDPGGVCNGPTEPGGCIEEFNVYTAEIEGPGCRTAKFAAATPDGSRVFFTTTQQLVNADTDQTNDIYACDLPSGNPAPSTDKANPCAAFRQVSGAQTGADVELVNATSENGATVLFTAKGILADNEDALKEKAVAGDHNLYVWRTDASHPDGQTAFVGRLDNATELNAQATPDGRYLVFTTATQLLETDTDDARDVYRYDADTGELNRVSTNLFGVAGNGDVDAAIAAPTEHNPSATVSDDGTKIVFTTTEALSPADGNAEPDVYLWTPARVFLISTGSVGFAPRDQRGPILIPKVAIDPSGEDVYFESAQQLTPADGDGSNDVYDARVGGGFKLTPPPICTGENCQPDATPAPPKKAPLSAQLGLGNPPQLKPCPKGKVRNGKGTCVKKPKKHRKKSHKKHKQAGPNGGGGK